MHRAQPEPQQARGPEQDAAQEADARGGAARGPERRARMRARQHEAIDAVVEVTEPPQLLPHVVHLRERRASGVHAGL